ncbi:MAG: trehalase family glycosidase [Dehalococcoidia bacterium]
MLSLQDKAKQLLDKNARRGKDFYYTAPSGKKYPHQWSWDSSFHAIVNCRLGRAGLAKEELLTLLGKMLPDGTLPHIILHEPSLARFANRAFRFYWPKSDRSPLVQPPVVALAVREVWQTTYDVEFLQETLPLLERHFEWLGTRRRFGSSHLVSIFSPWESGLDHKPGFDRLLGHFARLPFGRYAVLYTSEMRMALHRFDPEEIVKRRYFNVREVLFNTVYALGLEALGTMFAAIGDLQKADIYRARSDSAGKAILSECYDKASGLYFDIDVRTGNLIREPSVSSLMPLALNNVPEEDYQALVSHLTNPDEFWLRFPIPSVPRNSLHFRPTPGFYLWRGPTWINTNWLIAEGLRRHGNVELADAISQASKELVERSGFREYYNPLTGEGGGEKDFGWSTLAAII